MAVNRRDLYPDEERWQTIGMIGQVIVLVVHTLPETDSFTDEETGRMIISEESETRDCDAEGRDQPG
ncbi:MAG: hypothetical protein U0350_42275 [Caldilineaceae bacterium]